MGITAVPHQTSNSDLNQVSRRKDDLWGFRASAG